MPSSYPPQMAAIEELILRSTYIAGSFLVGGALGGFFAYTFKKYFENRQERYLNLSFVFLTLLLSLTLSTFSNTAVHPGFGDCLNPCHESQLRENPYGYGLEFWALSFLLQYLFLAVGIFLIYSTLYEHLEQISWFNPLMLTLLSVHTILQFSFVLVLFRLHPLSMSYILLSFLTMFLSAVVILARTRKIGPKYRLVQGTGYLIKEKKALEAFLIFRDLVKHGAHGLSVSRTPPSKLQNRFGLQKVDFYWLTKNKEENTLDPSNLRIIMNTLTKFCEELQGPRVIIIEGFEYLLDFNNFNTLIRFLGDVQDLLASSKANLLLPVNPAAFEEKDLARLESNLEELTL